MAAGLKKVFIGIGILVIATITLLVVLMIIGIFSEKETPSSVPSDEEISHLVGSTMSGFARSITSGDFRNLRETASQAMKAEYPLMKFNETFLKFKNLQVDWSELERHRPLLDGDANFDESGFLVINGYYPTSPQKVIFNLKYTFENNAWKLAWIYIQTKPLTDRKASRENMPSEEDLRRLLRHTLSLFDAGIRGNDFSRFYDEASRSWKALYTKEKTHEQFSALSMMEIDFSVSDPFQPEFKKPTDLDEDGLLHLQGSYENKAGRRYFELAYVLENSVWRMAAIAVNWDHTMPSEEVQIQLVKGTMNAFAEAVLAGDFEDFYKTRLAKPFQAEYSEEAFERLFRSFMDQKIDLRVLEAYQPKFDEKPKLDEQGMLVLKGYFPTRPSMAIFDMKFLKVREEWKLMQFFINIKPVVE